MSRSLCQSRTHLVLVATVCGLISGCQSIGGTGELTPESLLQVAESSPDAVTLDIYLAKRQLDGKGETVAFDDALWSSVQEDRIPIELRNALAANGLRAGVVGGTPSQQVTELLNPSGTRLAADSQQDDSTGANRIDEDELISAGKVTRNLRQLRPGRRAEILTSDQPRSVPLFRRVGDDLVSDTYDDAQGVYALKVLKSQGQQVELELTPELHFGQPRMQYTPLGPGMVTQRLARETEVFSDLRTKAWLAPGEMLLVSSLPQPGHKLGGLLHRTSSESGTEQQYLLVRLSQVPKSQALASTDDSIWPWR